MFHILTVGVTKPVLHATFKNGWRVVGQFTAPAIDNGVIEASTVIVNVHAPNEGHVKSLGVLTFDQLVLELIKVQRR